MKTADVGTEAPTRVAYYLEGDAFGGVERYLVTLLTHVDRRRFAPVVLGRAPEEFRRAVSDLEIDVMALSHPTSKWDIRGWRTVVGSLRRLRPAVFHAMQSHSFSGQYALVSASLARVPRIVVTAHLPTPASNRRQAWLGALVRRNIDVQIVPGVWAQSELGRLGQLARRTVVVPNAIDVPDFLPRDTARELLGLPHDAVVVGGSMRLEAYKRPDVIVDLSLAMSDITVVLFGEGPERARLGERAGGRNVVFTGFRADATRLLRALDVFVHPCPVDNQPLAVLEAMAAGIPVVVADRGGVATMVTHEVTGLLAPATPEGMGGAVQRLVADRAFSTRLGAAAAAEVHREADPCTMARRVESFYQSESAAFLEGSGR